MRLRTKTWLLSGMLLLLLLGGYLWRRAAAPSATSATPVAAAPSARPAGLPAAGKMAMPATFGLLGQPQSPTASNAVLAARASRFHYRLSNTSQTVGQLARSDRALLLENALIDTASGRKLEIPADLRAAGDPGSYIVQARGPISAMFRADLQAAGATIVSYIPNNAYLVTASAAAAQQLAAQPETQTVQPYEPYFKLKDELLKLAVEQQPLPDNTAVSILLFPGQRDTAVSQLQQLGVSVVSQQNTLVGTVVTVNLPASALAKVAGLQITREMELVRQLAPANDLARARIGVASDALVQTNYLGLTGTNILVNVNDFGFSGHPDFGNRLLLDPANFVNGDPDGHGTHVTGIIIGDGTESITVYASNAPGSPAVSPSTLLTNGQLRGKAPQATAYGITLSSLFASEAYMQQAAAATNALISNNSWVETGSSGYDLAAASFDAAVRDALPGTTGSQPLTYVFAAGNDGSGVDDGTGGQPDTINAPGTAKNVITVGSIEQLRNITNIVEYYTTGVDTNGNPDTVTNDVQLFLPESDSSDEVASYSSRGNVGIGTEGDFGRFKPDVVAPGSWVISTRSTNWDTSAYYNPTNVGYSYYPGLVLGTNSQIDSSVFIPDNAVKIEIQLLPNMLSPIPFPNLPIYTNLVGIPVTTGTTGLGGTNDVPINVDLDLQGSTLYYSVTNIYTNSLYSEINYDVLITYWTTNDYGNEFQVISNMNNGLGPWYRYESGTSMATPAVSGMLALMEDFFSNRVHRTFSPALMKALVINGARSVNSSLYDFQVQNTINYQGWGLVNLPTSLPGGLSNVMSQAVGEATNMFVFDQNPTNALATGQSHTRIFTVNTNAQAQPLRITLVWTDPPGDPAAGVKLVNDLDLVVTNLDTGAVYFGNDILAGNQFNEVWSSNSVPAVDSIRDVVNNVENVYISTPASTSGYSVTVIGRRVNVNAVTLQTNTLNGVAVTNAPNVVQDYALVVSTGNGTGSGAVTFKTDNGPTAIITAPLLTSTVTNGVPLLYQRVGAYSPLLGTNVLVGGTNDAAGEINQWHFYVFTNTAALSNANFKYVAFGTFSAVTLSVPREGVFESDLANATRPEADIDLYVSSSPALTNLDPVVLSNCVRNVYDSGYCSSLSPGGTETVTFDNSTANQVYYIGVKSEDRMASEYGFFGLATDQGFGSQDAAGNIVVSAQTLLPAAIPDAGGPSTPGALPVICVVATPRPITVRRVVVTNVLSHQLFGDLIGTLGHDGKFSVLNNHTSGGNGVTNRTFIYDDSGQGDITGARHTDGPGGLANFTGAGSAGQWMLNMVDSAATHTGIESNLTIRLEPEGDTNGLALSLPVNGTFLVSQYVPPDATNLTILITNNNQPLEMLVRKDNFPAFGPPAFYDYTNYFPVNSGGTNAFVIDRNSNPPLNAGTYYILLKNAGGGTLTQGTLFISVGLDVSGATAVTWGTSNAVPILDDAVTDGSIDVTDTNRIVSVDVGVRINHPRESDLVLTLVSPLGTRVLLAENRGGTDTNGYGSSTVITNYYPGTVPGGGTNATTNVISVPVSGTLYDYFAPLGIPDSLDVYYQGTNILHTGFVSNLDVFNPLLYTVNYSGSSTVMTFVEDQGGNPNAAKYGTNLWYNTPLIVGNVNNYFVFTDDTNKTTVPIKFYPPPFTGGLASNSLYSSFESQGAGNYLNPVIVDGWNVTANYVTVITNTAFTGTNALALAEGTISRTLPTVAGHKYALTYAYQDGSLNPINWWRGNGDATDAVGGANGNANSGVTYPSGEAGQAFHFDGATGSINFGTAAGNFGTNDFTIDFWVKTTTTVMTHLLQKHGVCGNDNSWDIGLGHGGIGDGKITIGVMNNTSGQYFTPILGTHAVNDGTYHNVAMIRQGTLFQVYVDGALDVAVTATGLINFNNNNSLVAGTDPCIGIDGSQIFAGDLDEIAFYAQALNPVQLQAIYLAGTNGLCGTPQPPAVSASLCGPAAAQVTLAGASTNIVTTTNQIWQVNSLTFVAPSNGTVLQFQGVQAGFLLDTIQLVDLGNNGYAQPEESLDVLKGEFANGSGNPGDTGTWQLEIWDNRAGAMLPAGNQLVSWQLSFTYENSVIPAANASGLAFNTTPTNLVVVPNTAITVTNAATDANPTNLLTYHLLQPPTPGSVSINPSTGVISWTPTVTGVYTITTWVTDGTLFATNSFTVTVINPSTPYAATEPAAPVTASSATLNGIATANAPVATAWFEWGPTTAYGNVTPPVAVNNGTVVYPVGMLVSPLTNGIYHFRLDVSNSVGVAYGGDLSFVVGGRTVWAWGDNTYGQTNVPASLTNVVAIAGGGYHSLALDDTGTVTAWGDNANSQCNVTGLGGIVGISGGFEHSLVLTSAGKVQGKGNNTYGQLTIPGGLNNVVAISAGSYHNLALKSDGTVVAWGYNFFGQTNVPAGLSNVVAVAAGGVHSLALRNDGTVVAWGDNTFGQANVPAGLSNIVAIAAGGAHSVALGTNGAVYAWGTDANGEVSTIPYTNGVTVISAQLEHSLEVYNTNTAVIGWGFDSALVNEPNSQYGLVFSDIVAVAAGGYHGLVLGDRVFGVPPGVAPQALRMAVTPAGSGFSFTMSWTAPTNEKFMVQWTPAVSQVGWHTLTNVITSTNGNFTFTDNGTQTGGNANERFYRLMTTH